ncbi:MAG: sugar transferase [Bacteroides sp.]|nr:sugar transferase [Bacteroides sp.]MCM1413248.1 sugar transferase [Bacteroides sp.]MCM1471442.1 sugar transferase [Bacteroides sp.]
MEKLILTSYENRTLHTDFNESHLSSSIISLAAKRSFDFIAALVSLIIFMPFILTIYIIIIMRDGSPAIFKQERIGRHGKSFTLYKFRTMRLDAEADGQARLCSSADDRLTPLGRFLRNHHLDELPQLWNVIRGDMSFVGYRPERKVFIDQITEFAPEYSLLYSMRPGLFSNATLYNGYTDTMEKMIRRLRMDLDYMASRSFFGDVRIIALTAWSIISGKKF